MVSRRHGGARPATRPDDGRRHPTPRGGSKPNVARRLEEVVRLLLKRPERFTEAELTAIGAQARSIAGLVEVEITRRWDTADTEE